jgi:hypothetical protein
MKRIPALFLILLIPIAGLAQHRPAQRSTAKKLKWIGIGALAGGATGAVIGVVTGKEPPPTCFYLQVGPATGAPPTGCAALSGIVASQTVAPERRRATNWKIAGPSLGAAAAGAMLFELGHVQMKKAQLSIRPDGAVRVAFRW